jgi:ankyrin repeat protein
MQSYGWTPLYFAADSGSTECVRILLAIGADKESKEWQARRWRIFASLCTQYISSAFVSSFFSRSDFRFCFFWLAGANSSRIALLNFESWRRCENSSQDERTALMAAAFRGHADCVRLLLDAGANGLAKDKVCVRLYVCACVCACVVFVCKCAM